MIKWSQNNRTIPLNSVRWESIRLLGLRFNMTPPAISRKSTNSGKAESFLITVLCLWPSISVSVHALVFSLLFKTFHLSLAVISQLRQTRCLFHSRPPIRHLHSSCHEPHSAYRSAFNILTCACLSMHSADPSKITGIHLRCSRGQMHSLVVAFKQDWSLCVLWPLRGI